MCGILGVLGSVAKNFEKSLNSIQHRGPDHTNFVTFENNRVSLGHVRLAIIDLSQEANQPIYKNEENFALVYNGEIYNYKELSKQIFGKSYNSDTIFLYDVLVKYQDNHTKLFEIISSFRGMWAFAFYDVKKRKLLLVRDMFGKKPLYFSSYNDSLYFSSQISAIFDLSKQNRYLNEIVLSEVLKYRFSLEESPFINIHMLKKGSYLEYDLNSNSYEIKEYFNTFDLIKDKLPYTKLCDGEHVERVDEVLRDSVRLRLVSDVSVGSITSGGLDSSLISAIANKFQPTSLYHVNVVYDSETKYAKILQNKIDTNLHIVNFDKKEFDKNFLNTLKHYEYPLAHPNNIGLYDLANLAKSNNLKVLLSGEGADETFGGYSSANNFYLYAKFQKYFPKIFGKMTNYAYKMSQFNSCNFLEIDQNSSLILPIEIEIKKVYKKFLQYYLEYFKLQDAHYLSFLAVQFEFYTKPLLLRADKIFMAHSVELRSPFFDPIVCTEAFLTPAHLRRQKRILKEVAKRYIPKEIIYREKKGFPIPISYYEDLTTAHMYGTKEQALFAYTFFSLKELI